MKQTSVNGGMTDTDVYNKTHFGSMEVRLHKTNFNQKYLHTKGGLLFRKCDSFIKSPNLKKNIQNNYPELEV